MGRFWRDLYYATMTGAVLGTAIGLYRRRAEERRQAYARQTQRVPPVIKRWQPYRPNGTRRD
jgi:hypothetical protein